MNIALDLSGIHEQTGVRVYAVQLLQELQKANVEHEFHIVMRRRDAGIYPADSRAFTPVFIPANAENAVANIAWHWSGFSRLMSQLRIDLVHQLDCNRVFPSRHRALVVTVHGLIDPRVPGRRHLVRQKYNATVVPRLLQQAAQIISVSNNTKKDLLKYTSVSAEKITVIHEGCALRADHTLSNVAARELVGREYGLQEGFILYVARLEHPNKNHVSLLKAYDRLRRSLVPLPRLVFVGGDSYRAHIVRQTVEELSLRGHVTITGFVPDEHLPAFYRCASVYACPTLYEGFGLPLLEAMQFGVPIICSDTSSLPELVGSAALKFDPHDVHSIAESLTTALTDTEARFALRNDGFTQLERFSSAEMARKTLEVYQAAALS